MENERPPQFEGEKPLSEMRDKALSMEIRGCSKTLEILHRTLGSHKQKIEDVAMRLEVLLEELERRDTILENEKIILSGEAQRALNKISAMREQKRE